MRKPDSDFFFEREVYDLLTNGILKDAGEPLDRDEFRRETRSHEAPEPNFFEILARRFDEYFGLNQPQP